MIPPYQSQQQFSPLNNPYHIPYNNSGYPTQAPPQIIMMPPYPQQQQQQPTSNINEQIRYL